jgi:hypothetical protein
MIYIYSPLSSHLISTLGGFPSQAKMHDESKHFLELWPAAEPKTSWLYKKAPEEAKSKCALWGKATSRIIIHHRIVCRGWIWANVGLGRDGGTTVHICACRKQEGGKLPDMVSENVCQTPCLPWQSRSNDRSGKEHEASITKDSVVGAIREGSMYS